MVSRWCTASLRGCLTGSRSFSLWTFTRGRVKPRIPSATVVPRTVNSVPLTLIIRCSVFTFASVSTVFVGTVIWDFEHWRRKVARTKERQSQSKSSSPKGGGILANLHRKITSFIGRPIVASDVYWGILLCNILVFLGNRSPLGPFFLRRFINSPYGPTPALSMLLSVFSHHSLFHLFINMYVLHSFSSGLISNIGAGDFLSLFIGGGVFASFISLLSKAARRSPVPSLGASGGICAILGAFCMLQPHARLCIPFVVDLFPHSFEAGHSVWVLLTFEFCASVIFVSRSPIDHAAHMGGLIFGMYYGLSGNEAIWRRRTAIVSWWRQLRGE